MDKDNPTGAPAGLTELARNRIEAARGLPREPPTSGLFSAIGLTSSFTGNALDISVDSILPPAEVTAESVNSSTVPHTTAVDVGNGTTVANSGTITVDSEDADTTLKPKFSSPPKATRKVSFTDEKNDDSSSPKETDTPVPPKTTPTRTDVNLSLTSKPLLSPPQAPEASTPKTSGTLLLPEGATVSFLTKNSVQTIGPLLQDTKQHNTTSSSSDVDKFGLFQRGGTASNSIYLTKGFDTSISMFDPSPTESTKYIAIPTDFPTIPSSFQTLESDAMSLQDSLAKGPHTFDAIATTLRCTLRCHQATTSLSQAMDSRVHAVENRVQAVENRV